MRQKGGQTGETRTNRRRTRAARGHDFLVCDQGSCHATHSAVEAVEIFAAGGSSSVCAGSSLHRCFGYVHMVTQHIQVAPSNIEVVVGTCLVEVWYSLVNNDYTR